MMVLIKTSGGYLIRLGIVSFILGFPITMMIFPDGFVLTYSRVFSTIYIGINLVFIFELAKGKVKHLIQKFIKFYLKIKEVLKRNY